MSDGDTSRVLHVDDDEPLVETAAVLLERLDSQLSVVTATTATEAWERLDEHAIDCIVSDYDLEETTGLDFLDEIREQYPDLPFILFTGKGSEEIASEAISRGVTDYLQKEAGKEQYTVLANRIENAVDRHRSRQALEVSRERLSLFFEQSPLGVIEWTNELRVQRLNEKAEEILGYEEHELVDESWQILVPEAEYDGVAAMAEELLASDEQASRITETITAGGERILCEWHNRTITDSDGNVVAVLSQFQDVTEREENRQRLEALIDSIPGVVYRTRSEPDWPFAVVRGSCKELTGYTADELQSEVHLAEKLIHPDDRAFVHEATGGPDTLAEPYELTYRIVRKDGEVRWVWERGKPVEQPGGERVFEGMFIDVTALKEQELALEETNTLLSTLYEDLPMGVLVDDGQSVLAANSRFRELFGLDDPPGALVGTDVVQLRERIAEQVSEPESVAGRMAVLAKGGEGRIDRLTLDDGRIVECRHVPYSLPSGDATLWLFRDVTDRKQRERQLEQHRESLEQLHDAANQLYSADSIAECHRITIEAAVDILGFDWCTLAGPAENGEEFIIEAVSDDAPIEVGDRPFGLDEGEAGHVYQTEESSIVTDAETSERGKPINTAIRSAVTVPVGDRGIFQAVATETESFDEQDKKHAELLVGSMVTAIDRLEQRSELERQNERLDQFASVVSHDLRNPLNVATGRLALARDQQDSEHLEHIEQAHNRMERLIDDVLTLAREGEQAETTGTIRLGEFVRHCWSHVPTKEATLCVETDREIRADRGRLEQLLENLLRNAVEHGATEPAKADLTVTAGSLPDGFFIEDDGPGIPESERETIFEPGHSLDDGGTGFGLSIVNQVVDAHDWSISVTTGADGGARFEITGVETVE